MKTSGALQITIEVPKEMALTAVNRIGAYDPAESTAVALAVLEVGND